MNNQRIGIGFIGGGFITRFHIQSLISVRNISLPGAISDLYSVDFNIIPPTQIELALHNDWAKMYGKELFTGKTFKYINVDFEEIANARRD